MKDEKAVEEPLGMMTLIRRESNKWSESGKTTWTVNTIIIVVIIVLVINMLNVLKMAG